MRIIYRRPFIRYSSILLEPLCLIVIFGGVSAGLFVKAGGGGISALDEELAASVALDELDAFITVSLMGGGGISASAEELFASVALDELAAFAAFSSAAETYKGKSSSKVKKAERMIDSRCSIRRYSNLYCSLIHPRFEVLPLLSGERNEQK